MPKFISPIGIYRINKGKDTGEERQVGVVVAHDTCCVTEAFGKVMGQSLVSSEPFEMQGTVGGFTEEVAFDPGI